jgi:hypothetical protein
VMSQTVAPAAFAARVNCPVSHQPALLSKAESFIEGAESA